MSVHPALVCVLIVLEVLIAVCRAFNCKILYGLYLPTVILTIIWYSIGDAENARHEIAGHEMRHQTARVENARHENAAPECRGGKCET